MQRHLDVDWDDEKSDLLQRTRRGRIHAAVACDMVASHDCREEVL